MRFRAIHLRAILLPLAVAVASIALVAWYGFVKIPAQQRYITDRNLRLLKTKSAQIKSKVDNFDLSVDHAIDFFPRGTLSEQAYAEQCGLLVLTSQQLVDAWLGYVPALAPAVPTVLKLFTAARQDARPGVATV